MSDRRFTPTQQAAVDHAGHDILVSASAGSGKTTVLVERVIQKILNGTDVDSLLVVTFTEAAASEMRQRIQTALRKKASEATDKAVQQRLRQQLSLVPTAQISTLHAFCLQVIKHFYYVIKLDPAFRLLSDTAERLLLEDQVWQRVREEHYQSNDALFYDLAQNFSNDRNDDGLTNIVFELFNFSGANPAPDEWLQSLTAPYEVPETGLTTSAYFKTTILPKLEATLATCLKDLALANELSQTNEKFAVYLPTIATAQAALTAIQANAATLSWAQWRTQLTDAQLGPAKRTKKLEPDEQYDKDRIKNALDNVKGALNDLLTTYFVFDEAQTSQIQRRAGELVGKLVTVTRDFKQAFQAEKKRRYLLDFGDLEHFCLDILAGDTPESEAARTFYQNKFSEILVDEYQDTNQLQETIIQTIASQAPRNVFMVGDVKQSIYAFRLADPSLFLGKYDEFAKPDNDSERIILAENFRSRRNIDDFVNLVFKQIMDRQLGQLDYDHNAELQYGATYYPDDQPTQPTELLLYETKPTDEESTGKLDKAEGQIASVAQRIKRMIDNQETIWDRDTQEIRPIRYQDIVLLTPTRNNNLIILDYFQRFGLPIVISDAQNYFQTTEIQIMLSFLKIIDNPNQDIPLVSVLRSPIVGMNENELALIRINDKTDDYYQAVFNYLDQFEAQKSGQLGQQVFEKLTHFQTLLNELRAIARQRPLVDLIWTIYQKTGFLDYAGGMPAGRQRQANLHALYERAATYEANGFKGLFQFIQFIERLQKQDKDLAQPTSLANQDAISVMTIHGSKGLEFPVVFLMDANHQFNEQDLRQNYVLDDQSGLGIVYLDAKKRLKIPTLPELTITTQKRQKLRAEEMRKLYVALTRAEQRLIIAGSCDNQAKLFATWQKGQQNPDLRLDASVRQASTNLLDWIGLSLIRHPQARDWTEEGTPFLPLSDDATEFNLTFTSETRLGELPGALHHDQDWSQQQQVALKAVDLTTDLANGIQDQLTFSYPAKGATETTAYQSVSEVKRLFEDPDNDQLGQLRFDADTPQQTHRYVTDELPQPQFMQTVRKASPAEIGTATHLVLQEIDLTQPVTIDRVQSVIDRLVLQKSLTSNVAQQIKVAAIMTFFESELGQQLLAEPAQVHREVPFSLLLPAASLFAGLRPEDQDNVLIHGIMDGYVTTDTDCILFDYKTDFVNLADPEAAIEAIKARYAGQINLYSAALTQIANRPVTAKYLYLLSIGQLVAIN
ncbi:helicase-exonuclease AddAB subunit AddA [Latilactobacillus curvatus]|uniref:helicase-exonuclease AddAB subunit AddA n=1 Tax=Latilactobacillus curvatus TaxID=28038 RepID=UPI0021A516A9|nr:helicase-exonuclease AddAB subunit AddA [Latilactobacillus curvatus]MCT3527247.1 helicase-exonuclease AddAB subunit AddA [Latilactobacillus curvatus]MDG2987352.1 helicase-exonuclease AddAB subunit AddA [Latilactobacillus curvatus]